MSERYSRLFALGENLYANGSPVVIAAGALLKDNQTGKVIAQLKLRNMGSKTIKAATVSVYPGDTVGKPLGEAVRYQYLDLNAKRDGDFGQKTPIRLPDDATRSFTVTVDEIAFEDNTVWNATGEAWEKLPVPSDIAATYGPELEKQFRLRYGGDCRKIPLTEKDLWHCACGAWNRREEICCHSCRKTFADMTGVDYAALRSEMEIRLAAEKERAEKAAAEERERIAQVNAAAKARAQKTARIAAIVIPVLAVVTAATVIISGMVKKSNAYENALAMMEAEQYEEAIVAFTALEDYKDSAEQVRNAENRIAEIARAAELEAAYAKAIQLLETDVSSNENEAYHILMELSDYKDAEELVQKFRYTLISEIFEVIDLYEPNETTYEYDAKGLLVHKKEADGDVYSYYYDSVGRVTREVLNNGTTDCEYSYYEDGVRKQVLTKTKQGTVTTDFDRYGSPVKGVYTSFGFTWEFGYTYAENGNIDVMECLYRKNDEEYSKTFHLDEFGENMILSRDSDDILPVFKARSSDGKEIEYGISYDYFGGIQLKENYTREYDFRGLLIKEQQRVGNDGFDKNYCYDAEGNLTQIMTTYLSGLQFQDDYIYGYIYCPDAT